MGKFTVDGSLLRDLVSSGCGAGGGVEATFGWKAPYAGTFEFTGSGPVVIGLQGGCGGYENGCTSSGFLPDSGPIVTAFDMTLASGDEVVVVVETGAASVDSVSLVVSKGTPQCGLFGCPPPPPGDGGGGLGGNDQGATLCLANAQARGETMCAGVDCACHHCPRDYDDCGVIPGCQDIRECMQSKNCVATECYNSGACRGVIDTLGGISGAAFRASARVQSCALTFACSIPCGLEGGTGDAGALQPGVDAGRLCEPGRGVACACEGGSGTKICAADGNAFGACSCGATSAKGCGCVLGTSPGNAGGAAGLAGVFVLGVAGRRARRRFRKEVRS